MRLETYLLKNLRVRAAGVEVFPPGATFGPCPVKQYEFVWVIEGGGTVAYDERPHRTGPGTILLWRPGMSDRYDFGTERQSVLAFAVFDLELPARGWPSPAQWPFAQQMPPDDILRPLFRYVLAAAALPAEVRSELMWYSVGLMLRAFVLKKLSVSAEPHGELPVAVETTLRTICDLISREPAPPVTLPELARAAHVSPGHLCRLFRESLDLTPLECVTLTRLERASTLLARSNVPIQKVAELTGFSSAYYFSKAFRRVFGMSPRDFRKAPHRREIPTLNPTMRFIQNEKLLKIT